MNLSSTKMISFQPSRNKKPQKIIYYITILHNRRIELLVYTQILVTHKRPTIILSSTQTQTQTHTHKHAHLCKHAHTTTKYILIFTIVPYLYFFLILSELRTKQGNTTMDTSGIREQDRSSCLYCSHASFTIIIDIVSSRTECGTGIRIFEVVSCFPLTQWPADHASVAN